MKRERAIGSIKKAIEGLGLELEKLEKDREILSGVRGSCGYFAEAKEYADNHLANRKTELEFAILAGKNKINDILSGNIPLKIFI